MKTPTAIPALVLLLLVACGSQASARQLLSADASSLTASVNTRKLAADYGRCATPRTASAMAVSIVYSQCSNDKVMFGQAIAQAVATGCSDAYAAGLGVTYTALKPTADVYVSMTETFSQALNLARQTGGSQAESYVSAFTMSIVSSTPAALSNKEMLVSLAASIGTVSVSAGCMAATKLYMSAYQTLLQMDADAELLTEWLTRGANVITMRRRAAKMTDCDGVKQAAKTIPTLPAAFLQPKINGKSLGMSRAKVFSAGVTQIMDVSSLAVTIAKASCPSQGQTSANAAIALATAFVNNRGGAADAVAGVVAAGADLTPVVEAIIKKADTNGIKALASALVVTTAAEQASLLGYMARAMNSVAKGLGCKQVQLSLPTLRQNIGTTSPALMMKLCTLIVDCPGFCSSTY